MPIYTHGFGWGFWWDITGITFKKEKKPPQQNICTCYSRYRHPGEHKFPWIDVLFYHLLPHFLKMPAHLNFQYISCIWCVHGSPSLHQSRLVLVASFLASLQIVTHDKTTVLITASVPSSVTVTITAMRAQYLQQTVKYYCSCVW